MSQENVEIVLSLYAAMNERNRVRTAELLDQDVEWVPDSRLGERPVKGREDVMRFFLDRAEMFDQIRVEPEGFHEEGEKVVALIRVVGTGGASGAGFDIRIGHVWTVRRNHIVQGEGYGDREKALEAAGLRE